MPNRHVTMENGRPHPVEGAVFEANVRVAGLQYKRVSGAEFAQITVLVPWSPEVNARAGAIAGKVCAFTAREVVDPVLQGMFPEEHAAVEVGAVDTEEVDRQVDLDLGDDGIPSRG